MKSSICNFLYVFLQIVLIICKSKNSRQHLRSKILLHRDIRRRSEIFVPLALANVTDEKSVNQQVVKNASDITSNVLKSFSDQEKREEEAEKRSKLHYGWEHQRQKERNLLLKKKDLEEEHTSVRTMQDGKGMSAIVVLGNKTHRISGPVVKALLEDVRKDENDEEEETKQKNTQLEKQKPTSSETSMSEVGQSGAANGNNAGNLKLKRLKAANEVAEINKLLGKPLTDEKALSFIKTLLLHQVHSELAKTMDQKSTDLLSSIDNTNSKTNYNNNIKSSTNLGPSSLPPTNPAPTLKQIVADGSDRTVGTENKNEGQHNLTVDFLLQFLKSKSPAQMKSMQASLLHKGPALCKDMDQKEKCLYLRELGLCLPGSMGRNYKKRCQEVCSMCSSYQPCTNCAGLCSGCTVEVQPPPAPPPPPPAPPPPPVPPAPIYSPTICCGKDEEEKQEDASVHHPCNICEKGHPDDVHLESTLCKLCRGGHSMALTPSPVITPQSNILDPPVTQLPPLTHQAHRTALDAAAPTGLPSITSRNMHFAHSTHFTTPLPGASRPFDPTDVTKPTVLPHGCNPDGPYPLSPACLEKMTSNLRPCRPEVRPTHLPQVTDSSNPFDLLLKDDCKPQPTHIPRVTSIVTHSTILPNNAHPDDQAPLSHQVRPTLTPQEHNGLLLEQQQEEDLPLTHHRPTHTILNQQNIAHGGLASGAVGDVSNPSLLWKTRFDSTRPNPVHPVNPLLDPDNPLHLENVGEALGLDPVRVQELNVRRPENILIGGQCSLAIDIGIAVDVSAAAAQHWPQMKRFIAALLTRFLSTGKSHFGIITFSSIARLEMPLTHSRFNLATLLKRLDKIQPHFKAMQRRTDSALDVAKEMFLNSRPGVTKVLILIEHGGIRGGDPSVDWKALEEEPAERLRNIGVNIFVVGTTPIAEMDEMQMISGSESHSILLQNYNDLDGIIPPLVSRICNIASVVKRSESPENPKADQIKSKKNCNVKFTKVGCFKDDQNSPRPLPDEILNDIGHSYPEFSGRYIDWSDWNKYYKEFICRCAVETQKKGFNLFGIQGFATCRSGSNAEETYNQDGRAHKNKCIANNYRRCDVTDSLCVGKNETNFVYRLND